MWLGREVDDHVGFSIGERLFLLVIGAGLLAAAHGLTFALGTDTVFGHGWRGVAVGVIGIPTSCAILVCLGGALFGRRSDSGE
jgi:hypothetical protein